MRSLWRRYVVIATADALLSGRVGWSWTPGFVLLRKPAALSESGAAPVAGKAMLVATRLIESVQIAAPAEVAESLGGAKEIES